MNTNKITWTAGNSTTYLEFAEEAKTVAGAVRAARKWVMENCPNGEGAVTIYEDDQPIRKDEKSIRTGGVWKTVK